MNGRILMDTPRQAADEPWLIVLRGNSGSGKTTAARRLQERFGRNTMVISQDVVRRDMLKVRDGPDTPALPLMKELLTYASTHSRIAILEGILNAQWYRPLFEWAAVLYGERIAAYYFDLPFEETLRRHRTRPCCREFGPAEMRSWWRERDYSDVLHEVRIPPEQDLDSLVADIAAAVRRG